MLHVTFSEEDTLLERLSVTFDDVTVRIMVLGRGDFPGAHFVSNGTRNVWQRHPKEYSAIA